MKVKDIVDNIKCGDVFGRYTILDVAEPYIHPKGYQLKKFKCLCECGTVKDVRGDALVTKHTFSCGCYNRDSKITHGLHATPTYTIWTGMIDRVTNEFGANYSSYMGRGLSVSNEWLSFENFYNDMGERPHNKTLHRINNDLGYSKENCVWAEDSVQNHVKRNWGKCAKGVSLKQNGKYEANIKKNGINYYLGQFKTESEAALAYDNKSEELYGDRPNNTSSGQ